MCRDSEQVSRDLLARGYELAAREDEADVVLLNTCSVRDMAEQKAIGKMRTLGGRKKRGRHHRVIGFLGCMAQSRGASILDELPEVDLVVGTQKFHEVGRLRRRAFPRRRRADRRHRGGDRLAEHDPRSPARAAAGHGLRFDHAGVQHALHLLHRPEHARGGALAADGRDRRGGGIAGRAGVCAR